MLLLAMTLSAVGTAVLAGDRSSGDKIAFDISRQRADQALIEFAEQANVTFIFPFDEARKQIASPLVGEYSIEEAIDILLSGTQLQPEFSTGGVMTVVSDADSVDETNSAGGPNAMSSKRTFVERLSAAAAALFGATAGAQTDTFIEEIVVTAQKREQSVLEVPISMQVVSGDSLSARAIDDTPSFFQSVPSITYVSGYSSTASSIGIRGVTSLAIEGGLQPSVIMIVDDVPYARVGEFITEFADIERIEVLRGPQGTLIGKNATAGALNIVTKGPEDTFGGSVSASVTDEIEQLYRASLTGPLTDFARFRLSGHYQSLDDFIDNINPDARATEIGQMESSSIRGQLDIDFAPNVLLHLSGDWRKRDNRNAQFLVIQPRTGDPDNHIAQLGYVPSRGQQFLNIDAVPFTEDEAWGLSADLDWGLGEDFSLKSITSYRDFFNDSESDVDNTPNGTGAAVVLQYFPLGRRRPVDIDYFQQEFRLLGSFDGFEFIAGAYYNTTTESVLQQVPFAIPAFGIINSTGVVDGSVDDETMAVFADAQIELAGGFEAFAGLRYTDEQLDYSILNQNVIVPLTFAQDGTIDRPATLETYQVAVTNALQNPPPTALDFGGRVKEEAWTGRAGLQFETGAGDQLYLSYSTGYKGPGVNLSLASTSPDNSTVDAEEARAVELGYKGYLFGDRVFFSAAAFYQETDNLQTTVVLPGTIQSQLVNAGNVDSKGFEIDLKANVTPTLQLSADVAYVDAELRGLLTTCWPGQTFATGCSEGPDSTIPDPTSPTGFRKSSQDLEGVAPPNSPEWAFSLGARKNWTPPTWPLDVFAVMNFSWKDEYHTRLNADPLAVIGSRSLLDLSIGFTDKHDRYEVVIFGKNLLDEFEYTGLIENNGLIGRLAGYVTRESNRYFGLRAQWNF
jgi:iron complex outermembrane receptor protein